MSLVPTAIKSDCTYFCNFLFSPPGIIIIIFIIIQENVNQTEYTMILNRRIYQIFHKVGKTEKYSFVMFLDYSILCIISD